MRTRVLAIGLSFILLNASGVDGGAVLKAQEKISRARVFDVPDSELKNFINGEGRNLAHSAEQDFSGIKIVARIMPNSPIVQAGPLEQLMPLQVTAASANGTCGIAMPMPSLLKEMVKGVNLYVGTRHGVLNDWIIAKMILWAMFSHEEGHCIDQAPDPEEQPAGPDGVPRAPFSETVADAFMALRYRQGGWAEPEASAVMEYIRAAKVADEAYGRLSHWTTPAIDYVQSMKVGSLPDTPRGPGAGRKALH